MKFWITTRKFLLIFTVLLLASAVLEGTSRHARKRYYQGRRTNRTFENSYKKSKKNFLDSYERASGLHPLCTYPKVMERVSRVNFFVEMLKKKCNTSPPPGPHTREGPTPRTRSIRNSRRQNKKKNQLSNKKKKKLEKLLRKSMCRPLKTMVPVEGPSEDEFYPCKVLVNRCSGCCLSRLEECVPTVTKMRKFDVLRSSHFTNQSVYKTKIEEHIKCECMCKVKEQDCGPGQIYEENNCLCMCPPGSHTTCHQSKRWSERDCKCICKKKRDCSTGMTFNGDTCMCEVLSTVATEDNEKI